MLLIGAGLLIFGGGALMLIPGTDRATGSSTNSGLGTGYPSAIPKQVDFPAPELSLSDLGGNPASLADYRGQVVLVNHWATWCPPCKAEMPVLKDYFEDHRRQGFKVVAIESGESPGEVAAFVTQYGLTFPVWPDPAQAAASAFHTFTLPSSYLVDRSGQVRLVWMGAISGAVLEKYVTPLLEE
jgi:cytochrome c biogenesis protein CcmG/thiol:disulfide interchange protein DsbE